MSFEWDHWKAAANLEKHGVRFEDVENFAFTDAVFQRDLRFEYGEDRWVATGLIGDRLHVLVYTKRDTETVRVISLRKANPREIEFHVKAKTGLDQSG